MKVITVGRRSDNDVVINDAKVSRAHVQLVQHDNGRCSAVDLGSANGTFVNGRKISGEWPLSPGDVIRIGNNTLPWQKYFDEPNRVESGSGRGANENEDTEKKRHGFVSFWLWLGIVSSIVTTPVSLLSYHAMKHLGEVYFPDFGASLFARQISNYVLILQGSVLLSAILIIIGSSQLLNWKRSGFWMNTCVTLIATPVNVSMLYLIHKEYIMAGLQTPLYSKEKLIITIVGMIVSILIQWAVLQIKKDGVSCWRQLK